MPRKKRMPALEDRTRIKIAKYLPGAIDHAIQSYRKFYAEDSFEDAKGFSAHHTACKAAIAHIELLLKLADWANLPRTEDDNDDMLATLMAQAEAELNNYQGDDIA